ncbi:MAG: domain proteinfibronectin type protein [Bacteroidota bacterium]|nr:domain proteinfibronectin type protein [Bacteroidota bacterium]
MKKFAPILALFLLSFGAVSAQCTVNVNDTVFGFTPPDSTFPEILKGVPLNSSYVTQAYVPATFTFSGFTVVIHWITITNVTGFPTGITYAKNPLNDTIYGGGRQCIALSGVTTDTPGIYQLAFEGLVYVTVPILGDQYYTIHQLDSMAASQPGAPKLGYKLKEVDPAGINDINTALVSAMQVVPNPNNGQFDVKFNYNGLLQGELRVIDITGKEVLSQRLDADGFYSTTIDLRNLAKGMYSVQLRTESGMASKIVSVE